MNPNIIIKEIISILKEEPFNTIFWAGFWSLLVVNIFDAVFHTLGGKNNV